MQHPWSYCNTRAVPHIGKHVTPWVLAMFKIWIGQYHRSKLSPTRRRKTTVEYALLFGTGRAVQSTYIGNMPFLNNSFSPLFRMNSDLHYRQVMLNRFLLLCSVNAHISGRIRWTHRPTDGDWMAAVQCLFEIYPGRSVLICYLLHIVLHATAEDRSASTWFHIYQQVNLIQLAHAQLYAMTIDISRGCWCHYCWLQSVRDNLRIKVLRPQTVT